jgi:hypothetical protein
LASTNSHDYQRHHMTCNGRPVTGELELQRDATYL